MTVDLKGRNFLKLLDFTSEEIMYLVDLAAELKQAKKNGTPHDVLRGKNIVLLFEKTSTRTRCSFEVAGRDLGMGVVYLDPNSSQMGRKESVADTARVLGRMFDGIEYRGYGQSIVEDLARYSETVVWNGLTTEFHPTQMIADLLTIKEHFGSFEGRKLTFMGDAENNVANSLMVACAKMGIDFTACGPQSRMPEASLVATCREIAAETGATIELTEDVQQGVAGSDIIYTDIWVSMGEPKDVWAERIEILSPYKVTEELLAAAAPDVRFMHCLPAYHDTNTDIGREIAEKFGLTEMEVADSVFEGPRSIVFDEAENRMHSIKAVMCATLNGGL